MIDLPSRWRRPSVLASLVLGLCMAGGLTACQDKSQAHTPVASSQTGDFVSDAHLYQADNLTLVRRHSHHAKTVVTKTTLSIKNQAQYADATHLPYANPDAPKGGELSMPFVGMFNSVNPFINQGVAATGSFYLYDTLLAGSLDESNVAYPQLAQAVSFDPDDASWIVYHIHPDAKFWDGSAVTADDVRATFVAILNQGLMSWRAFLSGIEAIEVLDQHRVKFYFDETASADLGATVGMLPIFAKKDVEKRFHQVSLTPLLGSGPYQIGKIEPSKSIEYHRNPHYWGRDLMVNRGRFNFDRIKFVYYQDEMVAFEAFKLGQYRLRTENDIKRWTTFNDTSLPIIKTTIKNNNPVPMQGLVMNLRKPIFQHIQVRQAFNLAFDFQWSNRALLYGAYDRLTSYFYGSPLQASGRPSAEEMAILQTLPLNDDEKSALDGVPVPPISSGDGNNRQNLLKARQLLLQAGLTYYNGQLWHKNQPVSVEILVSDDKQQHLLLPYVANLQRLGIAARIRRVDLASYTERKRNYDFDLLIDSFMQGNAPGAEQAYLWGSKSAQQIGNQNTIGIQSQAVDLVIDRLSKANTRQEIVLYAKVLDRLLLSGSYMISWYGKNTTNVMYWQGYQHPERLPQSGIGLDYWWYQSPNDKN